MTAITMPWARDDLHLAQAPYPYGWLDTFLPTDLYARLADAFVAPDTHPDLDVLGKGKKRVTFMTPPLPDSLGPIPLVWQETLDYLSLETVRAAALDWVRRLVPLESLPEGPYRDLFALRHALTPDQVCWYCEFSSMDQGVYLPPHSDSTDKLLIFVHYFAPEGWDDAWGGGTEIYRAANPSQQTNFSNFFLPRTGMEVVAQSDYRPNRVFFFAKTDCAWHGVAPLSGDVTLPRRSFNFSLRVRPDADVGPEMAALMAQIKAQEALAFQR